MAPWRTHFSRFFQIPPFHNNLHYEVIYFDSTSAKKMNVKVSYFSTPDQVPLVDVTVSDPPRVAVVIDVLRATTTITALLENGAEAVETFDDINLLKQAASLWQGERLLVGERGGIMIEGFDLGNSPVAMAQANVAGKRIFMSTTNGTRALAKVRNHVPCVYCACLPNRQAVSERIIAVLCEGDTQSHETSHVWIIGSGGEGKFSLEDTFCAGSVASALLERAVQTVPTTITMDIQPANDDMVAAMAVWECYKKNPESCLRKASHGKSLTTIMSQQEADADFKACAALDVSEVIPEQSGPGVLKLQTNRKGS